MSEKSFKPTPIPHRTKFGEPMAYYSITFSTPSIEGTVSRRNKPDGNNRHPWKAEVNEDDVDVLPGVISGWYTEVYEPDFDTGLEG